MELLEKQQTEKKTKETEGKLVTFMGVGSENSYATAGFYFSFPFLVGGTITAHIPTLYDYDMTKDRQNDIRFHDKTDYDTKLAQDVSYHDFVEEMTQLAYDAIKETNDQNKAVNSLKKRFEGILNRQQRTLIRVTNPRYFSDLIYKRFEIDEVIKIQRRDDVHTISDKTFDFSSETILNLIEEGEKDALKEIVKHELEKMDKRGLEQIEKVAEISKHLTRFIDDLKIEKTADDEYIIQCAENELNVKHDKY
jgi:hypothetical protein